MSETQKSIKSSHSIRKIFSPPYGSGDRKSGKSISLRRKSQFGHKGETNAAEICAKDDDKIFSSPITMDSSRVPDNSGTEHPTTTKSFSSRTGNTQNVINLSFKAPPIQNIPSLSKTSTNLNNSIQIQDEILIKHESHEIRGSGPISSDNSKEIISLVMTSSPQSDHAPQKKSGEEEREKLRTKKKGEEKNKKKKKNTVEKSDVNNNTESNSYVGSISDYGATNLINIGYGDGNTGNPNENENNNSMTSESAAADKSKIIDIQADSGNDSDNFLINSSKITEYIKNLPEIDCRIIKTSSPQEDHHTNRDKIATDIEKIYPRSLMSSGEISHTILAEVKEKSSVGTKTKSSRLMKSPSNKSKIENHTRTSSTETDHTWKRSSLRRLGDFVKSSKESGNSTAFQGRGSAVNGKEKYKKNEPIEGSFVDASIAHQVNGRSTYSNNAYQISGEKSHDHIADKCNIQKSTKKTDHSNNRNFNNSAIIPPLHIDDLSEYHRLGGSVSKRSTLAGHTQFGIEATGNMRPRVRLRSRSLRNSNSESFRHSGNMSSNLAFSGNPSLKSSGSFTKVRSGAHAVSEAFKKRTKIFGFSNDPIQLAKDFDTPQKLLKVMREKVDDEDFSEASTMAFVLMTRNEISCSEMKVLGGHHLLVEVVERHFCNINILENSFLAFSILSANDPVTQEKIGKYGGVQAVLQALKTYHQPTSLQERAMAALCNLTLCAGNRELITKERGYEIVISVMKMLKDKASVQAEGCTVLANLAFGSPTNKIVIGSDGGIEIIIESMKNLCEDALVQTRACLALRNISWGVRENRHAIGDHGGVEVLLNTLRFHHSDPVVVQQCLGALCNVIIDDKRNQEIFQKFDGIEVIISRMNENLQDQAIQEHSITLLHQFTTTRDFVAHMYQDINMLDSLVYALSILKDKPKMVKKTIDILSSFLKSSSKNQERIYEIGGVEIMVDVLHYVASMKFGTGMNDTLTPDIL